MLVLDWVKNGFGRQKVNVKISSNVVWWVFFPLTPLSMSGEPCLIKVWETLC